MHHHINHCWCSSSEHNDDHYNAPNMVEINKRENDADDWDELVNTNSVMTKERLKQQEDIAARMEKRDPSFKFSDEMIRSMATRDCPFLSEEVQQWLDDNIKEKSGEQGWAMGNVDYRAEQSYQLTIWFQRRNDAKKFIKTFSKYKKATSYFDYMKDPIVNLVLDIETNKYKNRHEDA